MVDSGDPSVGQRRGLSNADLSTLPSVFREDLLAGKVVLISGAGGGIGKGISFLCHRLGAQVVMCSRDEEKLRRAGAGVAELDGPAPMLVPVNIRDADAVSRMYDDIYARFGKLDIVVNNAGGQYPQDAIDFSRKGWLAVIDTNLNGTWWMMQEAAKRWKESRQSGSIINIVANVERGMPQVAHTCAARAGVIYLSKTLATEWAPYSIRVNCIAPGVIETEGFWVYSEEAIQRFHNTNPMRMRGNAWDVAELVAYLASPAARFITGALCVIDGGQAQMGVLWPAEIPSYFQSANAV